MRTEDCPLRPWLVGEHNPYSRSQRYSLYPEPANASGNRLRKILGLTQQAYLAQFHRWNLVNGEPWNRRKAQWAAMMIAQLSGDAPVIMCGAKVTEAFGFDYEPFHIIAARFVVLPHPSGRNKAWNDPDAADCARETVRKAIYYWQAFRRSPTSG